MGKKRKNDVKLIVVEVVKAQESERPKCFGNKEAYCIKEVCGEKWFNECSSQEPL